MGRTQADEEAQREFEQAIRAEERRQLRDALLCALDKAAIYSITVGPLHGPMTPRRCIILDSAKECVAAIFDEASADPAPRSRLTTTQADEIEAEIRRLEADLTVTKHTLRLFLQHPMPCGHAAGNLLTCDRPPNGCVICGEPPARCNHGEPA